MTAHDEEGAGLRIQAVVKDIENAETVDAAEFMQRAAAGIRGDEPPPHDGGHDGDRDPPDIEDDRPELPAGCPVTPLGIQDDFAFYLDANRQLRPLKFEKHSRLGVLGLFGAKQQWMKEAWPRMKQDKETGRWYADGWRPEQVAENLIAAAALKGVFNALDKARGAGAWRGADGELILHCGDGVFIGPRPDEHREGSWHDPGVIGRYVFPAAPASPRPHSLATATGDDGPGYELLQLLLTWPFKRGDLDAMLLLGWIGAAMVGGALDWRPLMWITGGPGTGKSTLHRLIRQVFDENLISVSDASAAGIWQAVQHSTLPIAFDELEAEEDNRPTNKVIKLARQAASGGLVLRGGADHKGAEFTARSCFLFSSINIPPLLGQDRSRMAILELGTFTDDAVAPTLRADHFRDLGSRLLRLLVDHWADLGRAIETYRAELLRRRYDARAADVFGTLLACAHVMLHGADLDTYTVEAWAEKLKTTAAIDSGDAIREEEACLQRISTYQVEPFRSGGQSMLGEWIEKAFGVRAQPEDERDAQKIIQRYGLKVLHDMPGGPMLAVANSHSGLEAIFKGTKWQSRSGSTQGGWVQSLRRLNGADVADGPIYYAGAKPIRSTVLPRDTVIYSDNAVAEIFGGGDDSDPGGDPLDGGDQHV